MEELADLAVEVEVPGIAVGWVHAEDCVNGPSPPGLAAALQWAVEEALAGKDSAESAARRSAVRDMLRFGAYKPTGRGKPASEYLLNAAAAGEFPVISALVDINNLVSVSSLLPISLVDLGLADAEAFVVRRGREGESYVFNPSGQVLDLRDLLLTARRPGDRPCASPVKDSQATKTHEATTRVLGVVYAPARMAAQAVGAADLMGKLLAEHCGARARWGLAG
jgi:DNA/RNA-binding domain of Phe-tRNA-synthetase-like protein